VQEAALSSHTVELEPPPPPKHPHIACTDFDLRQLPEGAHTEAPGYFISEIPPDLSAQTHQLTEESDGRDSEDTPEKEAADASDFVDPKTIDFETTEDVDIRSDLGPHRGTVLDWDILA
jgi:hypothetical protein